jgi:hypothetical protein
VISENAQDAAAGAPGVLAEIRVHTEVMRSSACARGTSLLPPLLMLGTSERVGSNWLSDTLRPVMEQHNEPFRQQLGAVHPLSALNPQAVPVGEVTGMGLGAYGRHWLVTFVTSKYGTVRQGVKETNLFFAMASLLALFPDSPVAVLSRSPLGVASSFLRSGLFARWDYRSRYQQILTMTRSGRECCYASLVPDDDPPDIVALTRLQVLNTVLLAGAVHGRDIAHIPYEATVQSNQTALAELVRVAPELAGRLAVARGGTSGSPPRPGVPGREDSIYSTAAAKEELVAHLSEAEGETVHEAIAAALATAASVLPAGTAGRAAAWLGGGQHYRLTPPIRPRSPGPAEQRYPGTRTAVSYVRRGELDWRNLLVTNAEFTVLLNELAQAGLASSQAGTPLLACEMPHERGGRLHYDPDARRWRVSHGYEKHPVYWVTWIGAAAFAATRGARLPRRAELIELTIPCPGPILNAGYRFADVTPAIEPGLGGGDIHHLVGNLQVWCGDGPDSGQLCDGPAARWLHGAAWNTPDTSEEIHRPRWRHLTGSSRGVGIRLVRDGACPPVSAVELARRLQTWLISLDDRSSSFAEADERLIRALGDSQADAGLGPHVTAGAGEPRRG